MNSAKYLLGTLAATAMLAACSTDSADYNFPGKGSEVVVNATIAGEDATRTSPDDNSVTKFSDGDKISVSNGSSVVYQYDDANSKWVSVAGDFLTWDSEQGTFQAFYPVNGTNTFELGHLPQNQGGLASLAAGDYMTGKTTYSAVPDDRTLSLMMERQTALIVIGEKGITWGDEFNGNAAISECKVMSSLLVPGDDNLEEITAYRKSANCYYAIVSPTPNGKDGTFIKLKVAYTDDSGQAATKDLVINTIPKIEKGKRYSFALVIGKDEAAIGQVSVIPWTDGTGLDDEAVFKYEINGNTITVEKGILEENPDLIATAVGTGNTLKVNGPVNEDDIEAINDYIKNCGQEIDLDLEDAVITYIPMLAFESNSNLGNVKLPKTLIKIVDSAFQNCNNAKFNNLDALTALETIEFRAFEGCSNVSGTFSKSLKNIGQEAFKNVLGGDLTFPASVTVVKSGTFEESGFSNITFLGEKVDFSGADRAFALLKNNTTIKLEYCTSVPTCASTAFEDSYVPITLHVGYGLSSDYANAEGWKEIINNGFGGSIVE